MEIDLLAAYRTASGLEPAATAEQEPPSRTDVSIRPERLEAPADAAIDLPLRDLLAETDIPLPTGQPLCPNSFARKMRAERTRDSEHILR